MAAVTYTEDRETFEAQIFRPPHLARMLEISGEFTGRLDSLDRDFVVKQSLDRFWDVRGEIKVSNDVERKWVESLQWVAMSRPRWEVFVSHWGVAIGKEWIKSSQLRKAL